MVSGVMVKAGATVQSKSMLYKEVVQAVLIYGGNIWVVTDAMMKVMELFHHRIAQRISGKMTWRVRVEGWESIPVEEALEAVGLCPMQE